MLNKGDIILIEDESYSNKKHPVLIIDIIGSEILTAFITSNLNYNGVVIDSSSLKNGTLKKKCLIRIEKLFYIEYNNETIVASLKDEVFENVLRNIVKYHSNNYLKTFKNKKSKYIPPSGKVLGTEELENMIDATLDMWLTTGRFNDLFEKQFAEFLGVKYCLTVNSGSSANLVALSALTSPKLGKRRLQQGDEVITVACGFPTTIAPIIQNGLVPVFVDVELPTYQINVKEIETSITEKTKAIMVAHTLGNVFDIDKVKAICDRYNLWLIEDNCDALGAKYNDKYSGTFGHIGTCSFYPAHHITMGEGGAVFTNDTELYRIALSIRDWGRDCWCPPGKDDTCHNRFGWKLGLLPDGYDHKYTYSHLGYNLKITDWQAACGLAQLKKLPEFIKKRKENFKKLKEGLKQFEKYLLLPVETEKAEASWFGFLISVKEDAPFNKFELVKYLETNGIGTRQLFAGNMLRQPACVTYNFPLRIKNGPIIRANEINEEILKNLPITDYIMNNTFWIGVWPGIGDEEIERIINTFNNFISNIK